MLLEKANSLMAKSGLHQRCGNCDFQESYIDMESSDSISFQSIYGKFYVSPGALFIKTGFSVKVKVYYRGKITERHIRYISDTYGRYPEKRRYEANKIAKRWNVELKTWQMERCKFIQKKCNSPA